MHFGLHGGIRHIHLYYYSFLFVNIVIIIITRTNWLSLLRATIPFPDRSREEIILWYCFFFTISDDDRIRLLQQIATNRLIFPQCIIYSHTHSRSHMKIMVSFREIDWQLYFKITRNNIGKKKSERSTKAILKKC